MLKILEVENAFTTPNLPNVIGRLAYLKCAQNTTLSYSWAKLSNTKPIL